MTVQKLTTILLTIVLLASCSGISYEFRYPETPEQVMYYVNREIQYIRDIYSVGQDEYWQSPAETLRFKTGDCEDQAILMMYILYEDLGMESRLVILRNPGGGWHAVVGLDGILYDPTYNRTISYDDIDHVVSYDYALTMLIATRLYTKGIEEE